ncbi:MAG: hypothetical protein V3V08_07320 [Nannocystaceae bacterium]
MERERLHYLRTVVIPHIEKMDRIEQWLTSAGERRPNAEIGGRAILNFNWYLDEDRETGKPISTDYNCGLEGCLAGWYKLLAERDKQIPEGALPSYGIFTLADHFGIDSDAAEALFGGTGSGAERHGYLGHPYTTEGALEARTAYLDTILAA